jgi:hypothetical protein
VLLCCAGLMGCTLWAGWHGLQRRYAEAVGVLEDLPAARHGGGPLTRGVSWMQVGAGGLLLTMPTVQTVLRRFSN